MVQSEFPCSSCGALVTWDPASQTQTCAWCGTTLTIPKGEEEIHELDFNAWLVAQRDQTPEEERTAVQCSSCGAETSVTPEATATVCAFCGTPIVTQGHSIRLIKPAALLPFKVPKQEAFNRFQHWVRRQWFAPNDLKHFARPEKHRLQGVYIPFWTFDCHTTTAYTGMRGEDYVVQERYTAYENGKAVTRTRSVVKTRWYPAAGVVINAFDDVLVAASQHLPHHTFNALEPWDLYELAPYRDDYLAGFGAESYTLDLKGGFDTAKERMQPTIDATIRADIGGDRQQILTRKSQYNRITFKHLLLPLWICSYRYRERVFRFVVNGRTGKVVGERPWSWIKITLAVLFVLALVFLWMYYGGSIEG